MTEIEGTLRGSGLRIAIVASRFNSGITRRLVAGAEAALKEAGVDAKDVTVILVPGALEIPLTAQRAARSGRYDGIVAIGCVIRHETPHFEHVSREASSGIRQVALETGIPVTFGVLTVDNHDQAVARSEPDPSNRGFAAAMAAVEMVNLLKQV